MQSFPADPGAFRTLVEASPDPILTLAPSGAIAYANPAAERLLGWPRDELEGRPFTHLLPDPPRDRAAAALLRLLARAPRQGAEVTARTRDGRELRLELSLAAHEHRGARHHTAFLRDVTRRSAAERRLRVQHAVARVLAEAPGWEEAAPRVLQALGEGLGWDAALLWEVEPDAPVLCHGGDWSAPGTRADRLLAMSRRLVFLPGLGLPGRAWEAGAPLWVPDLALDPAFTRAAAAAEGGLRAAYVLPLLLGSEAFGVVELYAREAAEPDRELREVLAAVASAVGQYVLRKRSEAAVAASEERFRTLIEYASDVITVLDGRGRIRYESPAVERVLGYAPEDLQGRDVLDLVHPDDAPRVREALALGIRTPGVAITLEYRFRHRDGAWRTLESVGRSLLAAPQVRGVVVNSRDVSVRRKTEDEVRRLSLTDELTGLYNRRGLFTMGEQVLRSVRRTGGELLLLYADLDDLKGINDLHGHAAGDRALVEAGALLAAVFRDSDVVARVGGDEFVVLAAGLSREHGEALAERVREGVRARNAARGPGPALALSVGTAWYHPAHPGSVEALLAEADAAMYGEKRGR